MPLAPRADAVVVGRILSFLGLGTADGGSLPLNDGAIVALRAQRDNHKIKLAKLNFAQFCKGLQLIVLRKSREIKFKAGNTNQWLVVVVVVVLLLAVTDLVGRGEGYCGV